MTTIEQIKDALRQKDDPQSKCLLQTIEWLEEDASYTGERYCPGDEYAHGVEYGKSIIGVKAYRRLESIRLEWHNLTTE